MRNSRGFTLLEVLIALAILAVSLLAIFNLQGTSLLASARGQRISVATQLARQKMAQVIVDFETGMAKGEFPEDKEETGTFEEDKRPDFKWKFKIRKVEVPVPPSSQEGAEVMTQIFSMVSDQMTQNMRELQLSVSYEDEGGEAEEMIVLTTHMVRL